MIINILKIELNKKEVLENVNRIASLLLIDSSVESYGILHQMKFIEFRGQYGDIRIFIDSDLELYPDISIEGLTVEQKDLLILNQVNLKQVQKVECFSSSDIVFTFIDNTVLKISGNPQDETIAEPWQLTNKKGVDQIDYISIVGLTGDGYAVWGSLDNLNKGS